MIINYESMYLTLKTVLSILKMQYSLTRNEKTHLLWKFVRDLRDLSSDLKENCVLHIIVKNLRFSIISIKMVHIYCKYKKKCIYTRQKRAKSTPRLWAITLCVWADVRAVYELLRWVEIYSTACLCRLQIHTYCV